MSNLYKKIILIMVLIFVFILQTVPISSAPKIKGLDKIVHFFIYFLLTFLFYWNGFVLSKAVFFSISYGVLMEIVQFVTPGRSLSFYDFLTNCIGSFSFFGIYKLFVFYNKK